MDSIFNQLIPELQLIVCSYTLTDASELVYSLLRQYRYRSPELRWMLQVMDLDLKGVWYMPMAITAVCGEGYTELARSLVTKYDICPDVNSFIRICWSGHTSTLQWLLDEYKSSIMPKLSREAISDTFESACRYGHLEIAKLLAAEFDIKLGELRIRETLADVNDKGHTRVARWIARKFGVTERGEFIRD